MLTPEEKYHQLFRKMMYNISGHSLLIKRNNANRHIAILCDEVQGVIKELEEINFWEDVKQLANIKSKTP